MRVLESPLKRVSHIKVQLAAIKKCPQWKEQRQTTTPGSLPYSLQEVCGFLSPSVEGLRDWTYGLMSLSKKMQRSYLISFRY